jgi:hypothetical protein
VLPAIAKADFAYAHRWQASILRCDLQQGQRWDEYRDREPALGSR